MVCFGEYYADCSLKLVFMFIQAGDLCKWTADSQQYLLEHFDTINNSPSHIYHSAFPFCPSSSWLQKCYNAETSLQVKVVKGLPAEWGTYSHTVSLYTTLWALSYWKNTIAVGLMMGHHHLQFNHRQPDSCFLWAYSSSELSCLLIRWDITCIWK